MLSNKLIITRLLLSAIIVSVCLFGCTAHTDVVVPADKQNIKVCGNGKCNERPSHTQCPSCSSCACKVKKNDCGCDASMR